MSQLHAAILDIDPQQPCHTQIVAYDGHTLEQYGTCQITLAHRGRCQHSPFHVVKMGGPVITYIRPTHMLRLDLITLHFPISTTESHIRTLWSANPAKI